MGNTQQLITVENFTNPLPVSMTGVVSTSEVPAPGIAAYVYSFANTAGVVAANNFLTLYNPVGSGKTITLGGVFISCSTTGPSNATDPMRGFRISAAPTGGTVQAASTVTKSVSSTAATIADIRIANPTATALTPFFNSPALNSGAQGTGVVHQIINPPGTAFLLVPGEGVLLQTATGTTAQRWNVSVAWGEF